MVGPCDEKMIGLWSAVDPHFDSKETVTKIMKKSSILSSQVPSRKMRGKQKFPSTYTLVSDTGCQEARKSCARRGGEPANVDAVPYYTVE